MINYKALLLVGLSLFIYNCSSDDDTDDTPADTPTATEGTVTLSGVKGLTALGDAYVYEGWVIVDSKPVTTGTFTVDDSGNPSSTEFKLSKEQLDKATAFVVSIEPKPDSDPAPSKVKILAGDIKDGKATLGVNHASAINTDFTSGTGKYILATPTDGANDTDETSGVWFLDNSGDSPVAGLSLPTLPEGWKYEGWAVVGGTPYSTGTFTAVSGADSGNPFSGTAADAPGFPGEDFLLNAPSGATFPLELKGGRIVISVEPVPDNSTAPFLLKPLVHDVPSDAADHTVLTMTNDAVNSNPSASVSIK